MYSQRLLLELIEGGAQRKDAYEAVQRNAMLAWEGARLPGKESVLADSGRAGGNKLPGGAGGIAAARVSKNWSVKIH